MEQEEDQLNYEESPRHSAYGGPTDIIEKLQKLSQLILNMDSQKLKLIIN